MNQHRIAKLWERAVAAEQREDWLQAKRLFRKVAEAAPRHPVTYQRLGLIALREGHAQAAVEEFERSLAIDPADALCLNNLGNVQRELGRLRESVNTYRRALEIQPAYPSALYNLAGTLALLGEHAQAVDAYRECVRLMPGDAEAWNALGLSLLELGREGEATAALEQALRLEPNDPAILNELGVACQFEGNLEEAARLYSASIDADPGFARAYDNLVRSRRMQSGDLALIGPIEAIAGNGARDDESRLIARFALGKIHDDCANFEEAFENYALGNSLKRRLVEFDADTHRAWTDRVIAAFDGGFFDTHAGAGNPSTRPVFVIGMIRSGTSLVEQILASHSQVFGAGELLEFTRLVSRLPEMLGTALGYPECIRELDAGIVESEAREYLRFLSERDGQARRVVDKLPTNFLHLGLIAVLFPHARVVHCRREPLDVCLSIYFQRFAQGHHYAYDFEDIAAYYAEYERLMAHWRAVCPVDILDLQYEQLLNDLEGEARRMLEHCGLEWEQSCLAFHSSKRPVRTASSWQVRQPLYRTAMARWKKYEPHLDGLKKALSDRGIDWGGAT